MAIIGRDKEVKKLRSMLKKPTSEFVVVLGRRRVGKTFLIREAFQNNFHFHLTGLANATLSQQLVNFHTSLHKKYKGKSLPIPSTWYDAFQQLINYLDKVKADKLVVFIDELPWLDTPKSNCIGALEHFWNSWASARKDVVLIACGSAASWMLNKVINNKGGLHNRITQKIKLLPFTLKECEEFATAKNIKWNRYQLIEAYMAMGGIPYYWDALEPALSATQNIDKLFFSEQGILNDEFDNLYQSLFKNSTNHIAVVEALAKKKIGLTREEIIKHSKLPNGGGTTKVIDELETSGFVRKYAPFNKKTKQSFYQLTDFFTLFYLQFLKGNKQAKENYWINLMDNPAQRAWSGYAFELVCLTHVFQIKKELGINGMHSDEASWRSSSSKGGAQIDLILDRRDQVITICEMKFSINPFTIDKKYAEALRNKIGSFKAETKTRKAVMFTMITTYGLNENEHSTGLVQHDLTMDCLFD